MQYTKEQNIFCHQNGVVKTFDKTIKFEIINKEPLVVVLDDVLTDSECELLIEQSKSKLTRSKIGSANNKAESEVRTSSGTFFEGGENALIIKIENRVSEIMNIPKEHGEGIQILHYKPNQEYKAHHDFFKSSDNNRISTLIAYLNDVEAGGETEFPLLELSVKPKKGRAVYFEYFYENQELNDLTLHSGNPVVEGEKWVATQWMRRKRWS